MKKIIFILIILTTNNPIFAEQNSKFFNEIEEILPAKEVFKITFVESNKNLEINWSIEKGYFKNFFCWQYFLNFIKKF